MKKFIQVKLLLVVLVVLLVVCTGLPLLDNYDENYSGVDDESVEFTTPQNESTKNLYVVKAVVYEIGILTDVSDENETSSETQERVDLTFFDAHKNSSHIDLGKIPLPVQTNVSGQVLTAIAPVHIGAFSNPSELIQTLPLTGTIVNITHSDTAYFQLKTHNKTEEGESPSIISSDEISKIPDVKNVLPEFNPEQS